MIAAAAGSQRPSTWSHLQYSSRHRQVPDLRTARTITPGHPDQDDLDGGAKALDPLRSGRRWWRSASPVS